MKVSANWLQEYLNFNLPSTGELVARIGSQLGEIENTVDISAMYASVIVAKVIECTPLENSDHLNLCFIDDAGVVTDIARREDGLVQVVCGAPNVAVGATVAWLPPGATVPSTYENDPFVLEARELRGALSNGMLASAKELAIGDSHEGLLLLPNDLNAGSNFAEAFGLNDQIIDIENKMFTHRPDCFGQLGVAREVAGIFGQQFASPEWYVAPASFAGGEGLPLAVRNEIPDVVPRFMAVTLKNASIAPSPIWLQTKLSRVGVRPINNVVDITNYMMLLTGQPLHAYDYDKVAALSETDGATIVVRYPAENEELELLSGKTIQPRAEAAMIATDKQVIGLGGVMGGGNTEVDTNTKNIILECANFNMYSIRRTSMAHGLFTDAVTRFNKGQSPLQIPAVLSQSVVLLQQLAQAEPASAVIDDNHVVDDSKPITVTTSFINDRLGLNLSAQDITQLLTNVEFKVEITDQVLTVVPPFWRTDIGIPEDIVEEVGRLHGFDTLPLVLPVRSISPTNIDPLLQLKTQVRASLARLGANELVTYSFVHGDLLNKVTQQPHQAYRLSNALSPDLQYYRFHALPSLLEKVHANIKAGYDAFAIFELNKGHDTTQNDPDSNLPLENEFLDLVYASKQQLSGAPFYQARRYLDGLAHSFGLQVRYVPVHDEPSNQVAKPYDLRRSAYVKVIGTDLTLGIVGEFKRSVLKSLKLPDYSAGFTIGQRELLAARNQAGNGYRQLSRYPKVEQDVCFRVSHDLSFGELADFVDATLLTQQPPHTSYTLQTLDIYQREDDQAHKQITFRVTLSNDERTMTDAEMNKLLVEVSVAVAGQFNGERV